MPCIEMPEVAYLYGCLLVSIRVHTPDSVPNSCVEHIGQILVTDSICLTSTPPQPVYASPFPHSVHTRMDDSK
jgi:hypothetical protein